MKRFLLGVLVASVLWLGLLYAQSAGVIEIFGAGDSDRPAEIATAVDAGAEADSEPQKKKKKRRGKRKKSQGWTSSSGHDLGHGESGDELGGAGPHEISMGQAGGEQQLSPAQIDRGIDTVWNGIQRCLVLVPSDLPATGKVVLGMSIASSGVVTKVNLKGPKPIISGECGACIRRAVKRIRFPLFDGPEMVAHYPIVFD
jgi:hypothetical protein